MADTRTVDLKIKRMSESGTVMLPFIISFQSTVDLQEDAVSVAGWVRTLAADKKSLFFVKKDFQVPARGTTVKLVIAKNVQGDVYCGPDTYFGNVEHPRPLTSEVAKRYDPDALSDDVKRAIFIPALDGHYYDLIEAKRQFSVITRDWNQHLESLPGLTAQKVAPDTSAAVAAEKEFKLDLKKYAEHNAKKGNKLFAWVDKESYAVCKDMLKHAALMMKERPAFKAQVNEKGEEWRGLLALAAVVIHWAEEHKGEKDIAVFLEEEDVIFPTGVRVTRNEAKTFAEKLKSDEVTVQDFLENYIGRFLQRYDGYIAEKK